ncbi:hypothetical protein IWQ49_006372 [Labrenzia sp. EL_126]|nr:hypothetical protein [Labrenzia sp. EL_126]
MTHLAGFAIDRRAWLVSRSRSAAGSYNSDGDWVPAAPVSEDIRAVIQPARGNQLMDLPEGIRTEADWIMWSRSDLLVDDQIASKGITYRVLFTWERDQDGEFYRAALGRMK